MIKPVYLLIPPPTQHHSFYLFYNKESVKIPQELHSIFKTNFISKANNSVVSMLYTLIKHATISQSESLLEWFK